MFQWMDHCSWMDWNRIDRHSELSHNNKKHSFQQHWSESIFDFWMSELSLKSWVIDIISLPKCEKHKTFLKTTQGMQCLRAPCQEAEEEAREAEERLEVCNWYTLYQIPARYYLVHYVLNTWYSVPNTWYIEPNTWYMVTTPWYLVTVPYFWALSACLFTTELKKRISVPTSTHHKFFNVKSLQLIWTMTVP